MRDFRHRAWRGAPATRYPCCGAKIRAHAAAAGDPHGQASTGGRRTGTRTGRALGALLQGMASPIPWDTVATDRQRDIARATQHVRNAKPPLVQGAPRSGGELETHRGTRGLARSAAGGTCECVGRFLSLRDRKWRSRPISRVLSWTVIPLGARSPVRSSSLPGSAAGHGIASLFGLAPGGVCRAGLLPGSRCALTAPFHPCLLACANVSGIFLLHFPSARAAQALPGTVPCGARTFLGTGCPVTRLPGRLRHAHCRTRPRSAGHGRCGRFSRRAYRPAAPPSPPGGRRCGRRRRTCRPGTSRPPRAGPGCPARRS